MGNRTKTTTYKATTNISFLIGYLYDTEEITLRQINPKGVYLEILKGDNLTVTEPENPHSSKNYAIFVEHNGSASETTSTYFEKVKKGDLIPA